LIKLVYDNLHAWFLTRYSYAAWRVYGTIVVCDSRMYDPG